MEKVVLLELQLAGVVVAEDVAQLCLGDVAVHLGQMVEADSLGGRRAGPWRAGHVEFHCHVGGVDHSVLALPGWTEKPWMVTVADAA